MRPTYGEVAGTDQRGRIAVGTRTESVGRGTGQGLTLARAVVSRLDGQIGFVSTPGLGTTFTVRLPETPGYGATMADSGAMRAPAA